MVNISEFKIFAVVGAGTMGQEIAQVALMSGSFDKVILNDLSDEVLQGAKIYIENGIKKMEGKGKLPPQETTDSIMKALVIETNLEKAVSNADFVVEAIPEVMKLKQDLFAKLAEYSPKHAILTTNTSTMSITEIASTSERDENIVGMHFFTPIPVLRLIEIIKGEKTSDEAVEITATIGQKLPALKGKRVTPIIKESPGFIVNRLTITSNIYLSWLLDEAMKNDIPFSCIDADVANLGGLGPCAKLDYLGLETIFNVLNYFAEVVSPEFKPGKVLSTCIKEGNLGRKTGKGLYVWKDGKPILDNLEKAGLFNPELYMAIQLNEGCRLLEEGIVSGYKIIDDTMMAGMDMPGPFGSGKKNYEKWTKLLEEFSEKSGIEYVKPCDLMKSGEFLKMRK